MARVSEYWLETQRYKQEYRERQARERAIQKEKYEKPLALVPFAAGFYQLNQKVSYRQWQLIKQYFQRVTSWDETDINPAADSEVMEGPRWICSEKNVPAVKAALNIEDH